MTTATTKCQKCSLDAHHENLCQLCCNCHECRKLTADLVRIAGKLAAAVINEAGKQAGELRKKHDL